MAARPPRCTKARSQGMGCGVGPPPVGKATQAGDSHNIRFPAAPPGA